MIHPVLRHATAALAAFLLVACGSGATPPELPVLPAVSTSPAGMTQADNAAVDAYVQAKMVEGNIPGVSLAVMDNGRLLYAKAYGYADLAGRTPARPEHRFEIGSISKTFVTMATMLLVEEGKIKLDEKISTYIGPVLPSWEAITIRHLLNHSSGLPEYPTDAARAIVEGTRIVPEEEILTLYKTFPAQRAPGLSWSYSNVGFDVLGIIVSRVSGKYYGDFLQERVFGPLGMHDTRIMTPVVNVPGKATGYLLNDRKRLEADVPSASLRNYLSLGASGVESSALDLAKFDAALRANTLLTAASRDAMWTATVQVRAQTATASAIDMGLGWFMSMESGHRRIGHSGGMPGYICDIVLYPDDGISVVVLTNQGFGVGAVPSAMSRHIAKMFRPELPE